MTILATDNAPSDKRFSAKRATEVECPRCLFTNSIAVIGKNQCEYCDLHDTLSYQSNPDNLYREIDRIKKDGEGKQYDCLIGISGGLDSSLLLYLSVVKFKLRPLVIHFDNGFNNSQAESNMKNLINHLSVNSITYRLDSTEYMDLNIAFLKAGVRDADIPNDIAMTKLMYQTADFYGIKWILNGHDFRTEGSTPKGWTYMDAKYIQSIYTQFTGKKLKNYPLFTFKDQIIYGLKGIKQIRPFHYILGRHKIEYRMKEAINWQEYGGKHCENIYTEYVGAKLLPEKFNIDKRLVYLSAQVRSGVMSKSEAKLIMQIPPRFDMNKLGELRYRIEEAAQSEKQDRSNFKKYNFKKYRIIVYLLMKLKIVPYTFYVKYCK